MLMKAKKGKCLLIDNIGETAMLELLAEEATELSFACQKLARLLRGENPVYGYTEEQLVEDIHEEVADVAVCFKAMSCTEMLDDDKVEDIMNAKFERIRERFKGKEEKNDAESGA